MVTRPLLPLGAGRGARDVRMTLRAVAAAAALVASCLAACGGVPEVAALPDGRLRLYGCANGIESYISANSGQSWTREAVVAPSGTLGARTVCGPSYVADAGLFVFKIG